MRNTSLRIYRIIREIGGSPEKIERDSRLKDDIGFDSFDLCCLFNNVEYRCNVMFSQDEINDMRTVGNLIDHVNYMAN